MKQENTKTYKQGTNLLHTASQVQGFINEYNLIEWEDGHIDNILDIETMQEYINNYNQSIKETMNPLSFERLYSEKEYLTTDDNPRTPYTPKETTMTQDTSHRIIQAPKESSNTVVVITWESGMVNVYRKDSKELLEVLIHEHHMIYEVMEAEMIP